MPLKYEAGGQNTTMKNMTLDPQGDQMVCVLIFPNSTSSRFSIISNGVFSNIFKIPDQMAVFKFCLIVSEICDISEAIIHVGLKHRSFGILGQHPAPPYRAGEAGCNVDL